MFEKQNTPYRIETITTAQKDVQTWTWLLLVEFSQISNLKKKAILITIPSIVFFFVSEKKII